MARLGVSGVSSVSGAGSCIGDGEGSGLGDRDFGGGDTFLLELGEGERDTGEFRKSSRRRGIGRRRVTFAPKSRFAMPDGETCE